DEQAFKDLDAVVAWAGKNARANTEKMAITGFCRGGRTVWMYDAHQPKIDAGVAWYGGLSPAEPAIKTTPLDAVAKLHGPVLGLYGGADQGIPQEQVDKLSAALKASGNKKAKDSTIHVYPGMPHGFNADYRPSYRKDAAEDGWKRMLAWFKKNGVGLRGGAVNKKGRHRRPFSLQRENLVGVDARLLDERRPFVHLALQVRLERLRRALLRRHGRGPELGEALLHHRVLQAFLERGDELVEHGLRRALGRVQAVPDGDLEALQSLLVEGRQVGQRRHARLGRDAVRLHLAGLDLRGRVRRLVAQQVDLSAQEVIHRRPGSLVGHRQQVGLERAHEQHSTQVRRRADAGVGERHLVLVRLDVLQEILEVVRRQVVAAEDRHRHVVDEADVFEVGEGIEAQLPVQGRRGRHSDVVDEDGVAVGLGVLDQLGGEDAAGARPVLDDDRLPERLGHGLRDDARDGVGRPGREGHHQRDRVRRELLRVCRRAEREQRRSEKRKPRGNPHEPSSFIVVYVGCGVLARPAGFEPTTLGFGGQYSNPLS